MTGERPFLAACTLMFVASTAVTVAWSHAMSAMGGMPMPGGWVMSMAWVPMCGQAWPHMAATFMLMWAVMMVAMMAPSLLPPLLAYRRQLRDEGHARINGPTVRVAAGYFAAWFALGVVLFPLGAGISALLMKVPALAGPVPVVSSLVVVVAGLLQFTRFKARRLACCRRYHRPCGNAPTDARPAWRHGLRLGRRCISCCAELTGVLCVVGVMELRAMALIAAAVTFERMAGNRMRAAQAIGVVLLATGLAGLARG